MSSIKRKKTAKTKSKINVETIKQREKKWNDSTVGGMPTYDPDNDRNCPRAQASKYNQEQKRAVLQSKMRTIESSWLSNTLQNNFTEVPLKLTKSLRQKAASLDGNIVDGQVEVEVLQMVIVRENILGELRTLLNNQVNCGDIHSCVGEVVELIKAVRFQTVDIVDAIEQWQAMQPSRRAFLYRGMNYLIKVVTDLNYLDGFDEIVERFCFEFRNNPLAYRWSSEVKVPDSTAALVDLAREGGGGSNDVHRSGQEQYQAYLQQQRQYSRDVPQSVDGIDISRLRHAEEVIQAEITRVEKERLYRRKGPGPDGSNGGDVGTGNNSAPGGETTGAESWAEFSQSQSQTMVGSQQSAGEGSSAADSQSGTWDPGASQSLDEPEGSRKTSKLKTSKSAPSGIGLTGNATAGVDPPRRSSGYKPKLNPDKVKKERILKKVEEFEEMGAIKTHLEEQIQTLVKKYKEHTTTKTLAEFKLQEARSLGRNQAAQHISIEISMINSEMTEFNQQIRDHQRQIYFITEERKRVKKMITMLKDELAADKQRRALQKQVSNNIREKGLSSALKAYNKVMTQGAVGAEAGSKRTLVTSLDQNAAALGIGPEPSVEGQSNQDPAGGPLSPAQKLMTELLDAVQHEETHASESPKKSPPRGVNKYGGKVNKITEVKARRPARPAALRHSVLEARIDEVLRQRQEAGELEDEDDEVDDEDGEFGGEEEEIEEEGALVAATSHHHHHEGMLAEVPEEGGAGGGSHSALVTHSDISPVMREEVSSKVLEFMEGIAPRHSISDIHELRSDFIHTSQHKEEQNDSHAPAKSASLLQAAYNSQITSPTGSVEGSLDGSLKEEHDEETLRAVALIQKRARGVLGRKTARRKKRPASTHIKDATPAPVPEPVQIAAEEKADEAAPVPEPVQITAVEEAADEAAPVPEPVQIALEESSIGGASEHSVSFNEAMNSEHDPWEPQVEAADEAAPVPEPVQITAVEEAADEAAPVPEPVQIAVEESSIGRTLDQSISGQTSLKTQVEGAALEPVHDAAVSVEGGGNKSARSTHEEKSVSFRIPARSASEPDSPEADQSHRSNGSPGAGDIARMDTLRSDAFSLGSLECDAEEAFVEYNDELDHSTGLHDAHAHAVATAAVADDADGEGDGEVFCRMGAAPPDEGGAGAEIGEDLNHNNDVLETPVSRSARCPWGDASWDEDMSSMECSPMGPGDAIGYFADNTASSSEPKSAAGASGVPQLAIRDIGTKVVAASISTATDVVVKSRPSTAPLAANPGAAAVEESEDVHDSSRPSRTTPPSSAAPTFVDSNPPAAGASLEAARALRRANSTGDV